MSKSILHTEKRWYAVRTKFRSEKSIVRHLNHIQVEAYAPLLKKVKASKTKKKTTYIPLIHSYVFVKVSVEDYKKVYEVQGVYDYIRSGGYMIAIPYEEIDILRKVVGERYNIHLSKAALTAGIQVEIINGSLTGITGVLLEENKNGIFQVRLNHIGVDLILDIPQDMLQPLVAA